MNPSKHIIFVMISCLQWRRLWRADGHAPNSIAARRFPSGCGPGRRLRDRQIRRSPKRNIEFDVVGKDSVNGKDAYWLEFTISGTQMGDILSKIEVVVDAGVTYTARTIVQMGNNPPMEMPAAMSSKAQTPVEIKDKADDLGSESVTTPAGTFSCEHYRAKDGSGDAWVSDKVTPFGLVKSVDKDGSTFTLVKTDHRRDRQNHRNACAVQSDDVHGPRRPLELQQSPSRGRDAWT